MKPIPSYRAVYLTPYLAFLHDIGAPVEGALRKARLPTLLDDGADIYLPQIPTVAFLKEMGRSQGVDEFHLRALSNLTAPDLGEAAAATILHSPTLKASLANFSSLLHLEDTCLKFWMLPGKSSVKLCMLNECPLEQQGLQYEDWSEMQVMMSIVRAFAGSTWHPEEMALRSTLAPGRFASEHYPNTRFHTGQKAVWITLPRHFLSLPPMNRPPETAALQSSYDLNSSNEELSGDFSQSLKQILPAYMRDGYPSIKLVAELAGSSVRTLQRKLGESNMTYSALIQQVRFERASMLLRDTNAKIIEISHELGYDDPAHFCRAFRRMAGLSPKGYRRQYRLH